MSAVPKPQEEEVVWKPNPGAQSLFLACPFFEVLFGGPRGNGKSDALIMCFGANVGRGYGASWRGIIFRRTYPQLADIKAKTQKWFPRIFKGARFNKAEHVWYFADGETLFLRALNSEDDYDNYHGHEYPFIGFEELANWPDPKAYLKMHSCSRSPHKEIPRMIRSNTNPWGVGLNWVKARFRLPAMMNRPIEEPDMPTRVAIQGSLSENVVMLESDPNYQQRIKAAATSKEQLKAWLEGDWTVIAGGMFDDLWDPRFHVLRPFEIPASWYVDRSFDWGSSKPFSVGWWAESDGSDVELPDGTVLSTVPGDLFRIGEWYGWTGSPNEGNRMLAAEIADGILLREEEDLPLDDHHGIHPGCADSAIFNADNGVSVARSMRAVGVKWDAADKSAGSRRHGWEELRKRLKAVLPPEHPAHPVIPRPPGTPREEPGIFIFDTCDQFIRTVPSLPRARKDPDDVDTDAEDHVADEVRYRLGYKRKRLRVESF